MTKRILQNADNELSGIKNVQESKKKKKKTAAESSKIEDLKPTLSLLSPGQAHGRVDIGVMK